MAATPHVSSAPHATHPTTMQQTKQATAFPRPSSPGTGRTPKPRTAPAGLARGSAPSSFLQGHPPSLRFGHPDVTSDDTAPPRPPGYLRWRAVFSGSALRVSHGRSPQRSKEKAERPGDGCPCVGAEETCGVPSQPAGRGRTPAPPRPIPGHASQEPVSCRSYPAAHSREREPNALRSALPPVSGQRRRPPRRCRCAPPARAPPNRQCR